MALYADENFPFRVIEELRRLGQDVLTALKTGEQISRLAIPIFSQEQLNLTGP
jgi:hypothetical protein